MSLGFSELINAIEGELKTEYLPGAIHWCDRQFDGAWSKAIDRFDKALSVALERQDYALARIEGDHYRLTILDLLKAYKAHKNIADADSFLEALRP
jgi:hypothetical protein